MKGPLLVLAEAFAHAAVEFAGEMPAVGAFAFVAGVLRLAEAAGRSSTPR